MQGEAGKPEKPASPESRTLGAQLAADGRRLLGNRRALRIGIVGLAVVVALIAWVATNGGGDGGESAPAVGGGVEAEIVSVGELEEFAASAAHAVYWAGTIPGKEIELSESGSGNVQLRYLDDGTEAGGGGAGVLTIGSYPIADPAGALKGFAERKGAIVRHSPDGREVVASAEKTSSVYFTGEDGSVQVEVYDPSAKRAMSLALSNRVQPVG